MIREGVGDTGRSGMGREVEMNTGLIYKILTL